MQPRIAVLESKRVVGISTRTRNRSEQKAETARIAPLWARFYQENIATRVPQRQPALTVLGVYSDYESDLDGPYTLTAGVEVLPSSEVPAGLVAVQTASGRYLVFNAKGVMPKLVFDTWSYIWQYFATGQPWRRAYTTDFEHYVSPEEIAIYVSVK